MKSKVAILAVSVVFGLSSGIADAQLVFNKSDIDGSFGQGSVLDAGNITYGAQPFVVTAELANANSLQYAGAFSADPVTVSGDDQVPQIDVRTWDDGLIFISTAEDALAGTPTASLEFNPLMGFAPNGQTYGELFTTEVGSNGQTLHVFEVTADLGFSTDGNPYHQITVPLSGASQFALNDSSRVTLTDLLANHLNETLFISSVIANQSSGGGYDIAATNNLGTEGLLFAGIGVETPAGFAHLLLAETVECEQSSDADIIIAFDFTGSTSAFNLSEQKRAANELLDFFESAAIRPNIGYVTFNTRFPFESDSGRVVQTLTSDYDLLRNLVDENLDNGEIAGVGGDPVAAGATHIGAGINAAQVELDTNANPSTENYMILISDGDPNVTSQFVTCGSCQCLEAEALAATASQDAIATGTILFTVHYNGNELCPLEDGEVSGRSFMREEIASSPEHAFVSGEDDLEEAFSQISTEICNDVSQLGDFDGDGGVDCDDLDGYVDNLGADATGMLAALDIDSDSTLTQADVDTLVTTLIETTNGVTGTFIGDLNCDGEVTVLGDAFALVGSLGQSVSSYSDGDLNFDGEVTVLGDAFILIGNLGNSNAQ